MQGAPLRILLIEDNDDHAELITRNLRDNGVVNNVYRVADGEAALDYLFRRGEYADPARSPRPGLILLDLRLPRTDGLTVLRAIKADPELLAIPVVVLTTSDAESDIKEAYNSHVNSYLVKPIDFAEFAQLIKGLGFYWLVWDKHDTT